MGHFGDIFQREIKEIKPPTLKRNWLYLVGYRGSAVREAIPLKQGLKHFS